MSLQEVVSSFTLHLDLASNAAVEGRRRHLIGTLQVLPVTQGDLAACLQALDRIDEERSARRESTSRHLS